MWMDQRNSIVQYDSTGNIATSCSGGYSATGTVSVDNPCHKTARGSEKMLPQSFAEYQSVRYCLHASRSYLDLQGSGGMTAPFELSPEH